MKDLVKPAKFLFNRSLRYTNTIVSYCILVRCDYTVNVKATLYLT